MEIDSGVDGAVITDAATTTATLRNAERERSPRGEEADREPKMRILHNTTASPRQRRKAEHRGLQNGQEIKRKKWRN
jgi:hypothetical protein